MCITFISVWDLCGAMLLTGKRNPAPLPRAAVREGKNRGGRGLPRGGGAASIKTDNQIVLNQKLNGAHRVKSRIGKAALYKRFIEGFA